MPVIVHPNEGANSFLTVARADEILSGRAVTLGSLWVGSAESKKENALITATSMLVTMCRWRGKRVGNLAHRLPFPRSGLYDSVIEESIPDDVNPVLLEEGTAIYADWILSNNPVGGQEGAGIKKVTLVGVVSLEPDLSTAPETFPFEAREKLNDLVTDIRLPNEKRTEVYGQWW